MASGVKLEQDSESKDSHLDEYVVQVCGLPGIIHPGHFQEAFIQGSRSLYDSVWVPKNFDLVMEANYCPDDQGNLVKKDEFFIKFKNEEDTCYALGIEVIRVAGCTVNLVAPAHNHATRVAYRKIHELMNRLPVIQQQYAAIGAVREYGHAKPTLPSTYKDKAWFLEKDRLPAWKRARAEGKALDSIAFQYLTKMRVTDTDKLNALIDNLYNEECDIWIALHEYRLGGVEFKM
jgi:hypothetical protein